MAAFLGAPRFAVRFAQINQLPARLCRASSTKQFSLPAYALAPHFGNDAPKVRQISSSANTTPARVIKQTSLSKAPYLADAFTQTFQSDPLLRHFFHLDASEDEYMKILNRYFNIVTADALSSPSSSVYTSEELQSVAVWSSCGFDLTSMEKLWLGLRLLRAVGLRRLMRMTKILDAFKECHPDKPHLTLMWLGTVPGVQSKGLGSSLMREMTRELDEKQKVGYLISSNLRNVPFYQRHGFSIVQQPIPNIPGGIVLTSMVRDPKVMDGKETEV